MKWQKSLPGYIATTFMTILVAMAASLLSSGIAAAEDVIKVKIGWQPAVEAAFFVAREDKLFEEVGLEPTYIRFNAGPPEFAALRAGDIDVGYMGAPPAVIALSQGIPVKAFYVESDESDSERLVVRPDAGINRLEDLKGKTVAIWRGTSAEYALRAALATVDLSFDDVKVLDLDATAVMPAFEKKEVHGVHIWDPWALRLEELGGKMLVRDSDVGVRMPDPWLGRIDWLENPDGAKRFIKALMMGRDRLMQDKQRAAMVMGKALEMDQKLALQIINRTYYPSAQEQMDPNHPLSLNREALKKGMGLAKAFQGIGQFLHEKGRIDSVPNMGDKIDPRGIELALGM